VNGELAPGPAVILLDIEGTTTPVAFVTRVLFPYARQHLRSHLEQHAGAAEYETLIERLHDEHARALREGEALPAWVEKPQPARLAGVADYVDWLMDRDRKSTGLKQLQGMIWEDGYRRGELVADMFSDVRPALERWRTQHRKVGVFSSGSVLAQQLLFRHSSAGDLTGFLQWYFDTNVGPKSDPDSYGRIAAAVGQPAGAVMFLSDVPRELDAARTAGMQVRLVVRPGNTPVPDRDYQVIRSFDEIAGRSD
jgi:enolase-phosphatase E1